MPECHKCPFQKKVEQGLFDHLPWEKTPCASCHWTGDQTNNHGKSHISIDSMSESSEQSLGMVRAAQAETVDMSSKRRVALDKQITGIAIKIGLERMTKAQKDVAIMMLANPQDTQEEIARKLNKTPQLVSAMFKVCRRIWQQAALEILDEKGGASDQD